MRICFFGDSFVNGTGDDGGLGWVGRVVAHGRRQGRDLTAYNLGIRRDTSEDVEARWLAEAGRRLAPGVEHRLLFAFGANDCTPAAGGCRVPQARSVAAASRILEQAVRMAPTIMVGPAPVLDDPETDRRIHDLATEQAALCRRLGVPFLTVHGFIEACDPWRREAGAGDGSHPNSEGYAALADFILGWDDIRRWLGLG